jgi:hypothetical protein
MSRRCPVVLSFASLVMAPWACGSSLTLAPGAPPDAGGPGQSDTAAAPDESHPATSDADLPEALVDGLSAPDVWSCVGSPAACNDDPTASAIGGDCTPSGGCRCRDGFSLNTKTLRCRPGNSCVAAGRDPWPTTVMLDHADCASRIAAPCGPADSQAQALGSEVFVLASRCGLPPYRYVRVEFVDGCPSLMNFKELWDRAGPPELIACLIEALSRQRWACTGATDCTIVEHDTLP